LTEIDQAKAQITVKLWRKNLNRLKASQRSSGDLFRFFQFKIIAGAGGNVDRIEFAFRYYVKFLDMGDDGQVFTIASCFPPEILFDIFVDYNLNLINH